MLTALDAALSAQVSTRLSRRRLPFEGDGKLGHLEPVLAWDSALGNAVNAYYQIEGDRHRSKLFAVMSGATSKGRKGTALGRIRQLMAIARNPYRRHSAPIWKSITR
jgi:hypothetical protein